MSLLIFACLLLFVAVSFPGFDLLFCFRPPVKRQSSSLPVVCAPASCEGSPSVILPPVVGMNPHQFFVYRQDALLLTSNASLTKGRLEAVIEKSLLTVGGRYSSPNFGEQ